VRARGVAWRLAARCARAAVPVLALLLAGLAVGCGQPGYVARLGWEQARLLARRTPIGTMLARRDLEPGFRERLELVLSARLFACDRLGLRVGDIFTTFAEVDDGATVHVVSAAHRDRLEAYTWWYPVVGRVPYRGFFDRSAAIEASRRLAAGGYDVDVRPAVAFSTLGWFADPLLSTTARSDPVDLVETVIHELFHATLWVPGAPAFNESAANFAGNRGAVAFFCDGPGAEAARCTRARAAWAATRARARVLERLARRLRALYAAGHPPAVREAIRRALHASAGRTLEARGLGRAAELVPPNNARLLGALLYATDLDRFEALAPGDGDPAPAMVALRHAMPGTARPFEVLRTLAEATPRGGTPPPGMVVPVTARCGRE